MITLADVEQRLEVIGGAASTPARVQGSDAVTRARALLQAGEDALLVWIAVRGEVPTAATKEGFRLLALHRQGAKGDPSFNACRETCRELVYHYNLIAGSPDHPETGKRLQLMTLVAKHLVLFISGKLEVAGLGEFCCSSKPVRLGEA